MTEQSKCILNGCEEKATHLMLFDHCYFRVCKTHALDIEQHYVDQGPAIFSAWAMQSIGDIDKAREVATEYFGEDAVSKYFQFEDTMIQMFTYGILKHPNNILADGGIDIVENAMVRGHKMYATGGKGFPVTEVTGNPEDVIYGTLFTVSAKKVITDYDLTEGYSGYVPKEKNMYNREAVQVIHPLTQDIYEAQMYIANPVLFKDDMIQDYWITTGNYDDKGTKLFSKLTG